jgi:hypothetical protein
LGIVFILGVPLTVTGIAALEMNRLRRRHGIRLGAHPATLPSPPAYAPNAGFVPPQGYPYAPPGQAYAPGNGTPYAQGNPYAPHAPHAPYAQGNPYRQGPYGS